MTSEPYPPPEPSTPPEGGGAPSGPIGTVLDGKWKLVRVLGRGGMGVVYEGLNVAIGKRVALKFIDAPIAADPEVVSRFQREAQAASAVDSAHIVQIFDTGTAPDGSPYLVMELLQGETLGARIRRLGRLSVEETVHVLCQVLRGLGRAHAAGVIHRDLKPDNIFLVDRDDDPLFVKLLDFGISKIARQTTESGHTLTRKGAVLGTPYYMSPEQAQAHHDLDGRTDLFSVGAIAYECLHGKAPYAGLEAYEAIIVAIVTRDAPSLKGLHPELPTPLCEVVQRALSRDRDARYASAAAMLEAVRRAAPELAGLPRSSSQSVSGVPAAAPATTPSGAPDASAQTGGSWSSRPRSVTPTLVSPPTGAFRRLRPLLLLGAAATAIGLGATLALSPRRPPAAPAVTPAPSEPALARMRVTSNVPGARVFVDGRLAPDGVVQGRERSSHVIRVEAPGHATFERSEILDGRDELSLVLPPLVAPADAADAAPHPPAAPAPNGPRPRPPANGRPPAAKPPAGANGGLHLKTDPT
ncbi:MAG TPA: serine/threonine-protein kinase [Polyangiaceae bacterium]|nr:serine/threonine-protein kinase [Polyangiaceae bacterium]